MENKGFQGDDGAELKEWKGHEGVGGGAGVRGRGPGLQGAEGQAESKSPGLEGGKPTSNDVVNLERRVGLLSGVALIVGTMIGSGIFVSPKGLLERTGSVALSLIVWGACGILSLLGALCYVELGCMIPSSGAEHTYFLTAFGHLPAFLFAWVSIIILKPAMLAIICLSFSKYLVEAFTSECEPPLMAIQLLGALTIGNYCWA
uniref:Amino acid permease/ SLC12A domain-containing protein n=1 Tax=Scylla olivacea TaxID=85551 RepID=A0A0P4VZQ9_SCYOL